MKKYIITLVPIIIIIVGIVSTFVFVSVSNKQEQIAEESNSTTSIYKEEITYIETDTSIEEIVSVNTGLNYVTPEETDYKSNYKDYFEMASDVLLESRQVGLELEVEYLGFEDLGIHNHTFGIKNSDITVVVAVDENGNVSFSECGNKYGSDYNEVIFEIEPTDRREVYEWLYANCPTLNIMLYRSDHTILDLVTNEVYDYSEYLMNQ